MVAAADSGAFDCLPLSDRLLDRLVHGRKLMDAGGENGF